MWECLYEGEKVSIFGILSYDTRTGQASMDETMALIVNGAKDKIKEMFRLENYWNWLDLVKHTMFFFGCLCVAGGMANIVIKRLQHLRL